MTYQAMVQKQRKKRQAPQANSWVEQSWLFFYSVVSPKSSGLQATSLFLVCWDCDLISPDGRRPRTSSVESRYVGFYTRRTFCDAERTSKRLGYLSANEVAHLDVGRIDWSWCSSFQSAPPQAGIILNLKKYYLARDFQHCLMTRWLKFELIWSIFFKLTSI